jgi:hypothetical protein
MCMHMSHVYDMCMCMYLAYTYTPPPTSTCGRSFRVRSGQPPREDRASNLWGPT